MSASSAHVSDLRWPSNATHHSVIRLQRLTPVSPSAMQLTTLLFAFTFVSLAACKALPPADPPIHRLLQVRFDPWKKCRTFSFMWPLCRSLVYPLRTGICNLLRSTCSICTKAWPMTPEWPKLPIRTTPKWSAVSTKKVSRFNSPPISHQLTETFHRIDSGVSVHVQHFRFSAGRDDPGSGIARASHQQPQCPTWRGTTTDSFRRFSHKMLTLTWLTDLRLSNNGRRCGWGPQKESRYWRSPCQRIRGRMASVPRSISCRSVDLGPGSGPGPGRPNSRRCAAFGQHLETRRAPSGSDPVQRRRLSVAR